MRRYGPPPSPERCTRPGPAPTPAPVTIALFRPTTCASPLFDRFSGPRMVMQATASSMPCRPPPFSASAMRAPSTCARRPRPQLRPPVREPARCRSRRRDGPWTQPAGRIDRNAPPERGTPRSEMRPPSPKSQKPRFSIWMISPSRLRRAPRRRKHQRGTDAGPVYAFFAASAVQCRSTRSRRDRCRLDHRGQHADRPLLSRPAASVPLW